MDPVANSELQTIEITVQRCTNVSPNLTFGIVEKKRDYYVEVTLGSETKKTRSCRRLNQRLDWNEKLTFENVNPSSVTFSLYFYRTLRDPKLVQQLTYPISGLVNDATPSPIARTASFLNGPQIEFSLKAIPPLVLEEIEPSTEVDLRAEETEFRVAAANTVLQAAADQTTPGQEEMKSHDEVERTEAQVAGDGEARKAIEQAKQALESQHNPIDGWKRLLEGVESFRDIIGSVTEAHPYAKLAHSLFFAIPTSLIEQLELDEEVKTLFDSFACFCDIVNELKGSNLEESGKIGDVLKRIALQMMEVAYFVRDYCEEGNFLKKVLRSKFTGVSDAIQEYRAKLGELKGEFHSRLELRTSIGVARTGAVVERTEIKIIRVLKELEKIGQSIDLNDIPYVSGAGLNTDKRCLEGTREKFLEEIENWVNSNDSRTLLISGGAGTGKSSIAHTIAARFRELGRLGSVFCFSEDEKAKRNPTSLFSHIARDLADLDPHIRAELARVAQGKADRTTSGITAQYEKLILIPTNAIRDHLRGPIVIVIDALDESGPVAERELLIKVLRDRLKELPSNFRIIITSRPERDIEQAFRRGSNILTKRMHTIPIESTTMDIAAYARSQFADNEDIDDDKCEQLASYANGVFQWASVACKFVRAERIGETTLDRYEELIQPLACIAGDGLIGDNLLDYLYHIVLSKVLSPESAAAMEKFKFVMARVLTAFEPLSSKSLNKLVTASKVTPRNCKVENVVAYLGSLLSGVDDQDTPIRPLHTSFRNFLADSSRSKDFFVDLGTPDVHSDMALASMQIMNDELTFNICKLETSYLSNTEVPGIEKLIKVCISRHLSYSCRFWAAHLLSLRVSNSSSTLNRRRVEIMKEVENLFNNRLLYCLEVLSLECAVDPGLKQIRGLCKWLKEAITDERILLLVEDAAQFFSCFSKCIATSVPHIYMSAIPFAPRGSSMAKNYSHYCNKTLGLVSGQLAGYPSWPHILHGHTSAVFSVDFSPDGTRIVSGSWDKTIRVWNAENGEMVVGPLIGHTDIVNSVEFSPDGRYIVSGSDDKTLRVWNAENGEMVIGPLEGHTEWVNSVGFSPDGTRIISGSGDKTIRVWNAQTGDMVIRPLRGHIGGVNSVRFSPDGTRIISGSSDKTVRVWNAQNGEIVVGPLEGHTDRVNWVGFSPDGTRLISASEDETIRVWNADNGRMVLGPLQGHTSWVGSAVFSPDGTRIVSTSGDFTIRVWNAENGEMVTEPLQGHTNSVHSVSFSPDGTYMVSGSYDNTIRVWNTEKDQMVTGPLQGHTSSVYSVSFSPDATRIVSGSTDNTIQLWNAENGELVIGPLQGHTRWITSVGFSPNGTRIVSSSGDYTIRVWSVENGEMVTGPLEGHTGVINSVGFSPDGTRIVSGSNDKTIRVWNAENGKMVLGPLQGHTNWIISVGFSPDGTRIVSGSWDNTIRVWDAENGEVVLGPLYGHTKEVVSVKFSPDGTRIISGSKDHTIRVWNAGTGEILIGPLRGHTGWVYSAEFSPDNTLIVSGSLDNTIRVWNAENGEMVFGPLQGHTSGVLSVEFSPDITRIVSGSDDKTIRIHSLPQPRDLVGDPFKGFASLHTSHIGTEHDPSIPTSLGDCDHIERVVPQNYWHMEDGWSLGVNRELLFYVPPAHRAHLYHPKTIAIISTEIPTKLDMSRYVHGNRWTECFNSDAMNENRD